MNPLQGLTNHQFNPFEPHPELDGVEVPGLDNTNWVSNSDPFGIFASRGMAPPRIPPPSEVRREAKDRTTNIFAYYERLQGILERHEATIRKRWEKKTRTQRLGILLQAWPGMPLTHRPDFAAFRKHAANLNRVAMQHRSSFIGPSINQEDLSDPKTLALLLNSRGRNPPHLFAASDGEAMHLGKVTMAIVPIFLNEYVMTLNGMTRQEDYGRLIAWDEHEDAFDWMHTRRQFLPGEGLLILEFQERLLEFLVDCCKAILHDIPLDRMTSNEFAIQPEPPLKESIDAAGFATLSTMAREAPYRPPARIDLQKIESLLSARTVRAEDHIWSLREDPSYFAETVLDMKEHLPDGRSTTKLQRDDLAWARAISSVLVESFTQLESFAELRNQAARLRELSTKYSSELSPEEDLPEEYLAALLRFRHYLNQVTKGVLSQLRLSVAASPPLRAFFVQYTPRSTGSSASKFILNSSVKRDKVATQLIWLLQTLWEDGRDLFLCRMTNVIDELDRLLKAEPKALEFVSPYIAMLIGELSIVGECLRQLEIFQPWANGFENALVERQEAINKEFMENTRAWAQVLDAFKEQNIIAIRELGDPSGGKFQYPVGKRQNKVNVETLRRSEANLDAFWNAVDDILYRKAGSLNGTAYRQVLSQPRSLQRTPEWVEPAAKKEVKSTHNHQKNNGSYEYVFPSSQLFQETETTSSLRAEALASEAGKIKVKRRGMLEPESISENDIAPSPSGSLEDVQPTFKVDARALKVFRTVFFDPAANTCAGEVAWRDFLHAMDSTGFTAQKLYGSVWHFQPTRLDVERSIQFHEPHPRGKIPFLVARRHGRRLNRAYGWRGAMFVLNDGN
ncbi:hypothetical protein GGS26DRAFT_506091 [Hypomontagnella submonticulosa]|nr:hypothetical protein GGS26DRAFT_506091 [Hypomontagnella submonticulosa]